MYPAVQVVVPPAFEDGYATLNRGALTYCERFLELLIDLLSQVGTGEGGGYA